MGIRQTLATGVVARTDPGDDVAELPLEDGAAACLVAAEPRPGAVGDGAGVLVDEPPEGLPAGVPDEEGVRNDVRPPTGAGRVGPVGGASSGVAAVVAGASTVATGPGTGPGSPTASLVPALLMTSPPIATATAAQRPNLVERSIEATPSSCS